MYSMRTGPAKTNLVALRDRYRIYCCRWSVRTHSWRSSFCFTKKIEHISCKIWKVSSKLHIMCKLLCDTFSIARIDTVDTHILGKGCIIIIYSFSATGFFLAPKLDSIKKSHGLRYLERNILQKNMRSNPDDFGLSYPRHSEPVSEKKTKFIVTRGIP